MEIVFGVMVGVGLTLIGIWLTEFLKNVHRNNRLINALYHEILNNIMVAETNMKLPKSDMKRHRLFAFHTIAYEQYKLNVNIDKKMDRKFLENLFQGYSLITWFNRNLRDFETYKITEDSLLYRDVIKYLSQVREYLQDSIKSKTI